MILGKFKFYAFSLGRLQNTELPQNLINNKKKTM